MLALNVWSDGWFSAEALRIFVIEYKYTIIKSSTYKFWPLSRESLGAEWAGRLEQSLAPVHKLLPKREM